MDFSSETNGQISIKFLMQPPDKRGKQKYIVGLGYITKIAAMPIYVKTYIVFVSRPRGYKTFFMLNSTEHERSNAHKYKNIKKFCIFQAQISLECYFPRS